MTTISDRHRPLQPNAPYLRGRRTSTFTWCVAIICIILTVAVIIGGIIVFVFYEVNHPKLPIISVTYTHLDVFDYSQAGILTTELAIVMKWENDNAKADARFYHEGFILSFHGLKIAKLVAEPFEVRKNRSVEFHYQVSSSPIPLSQQQMFVVANSLRQDLVTFDLRGETKTQWRVGVLGSVHFTLHLDCQLKFIYSTKDSTYSYCSSKSKS